jgi:hypothetical protein
MGQLWIPCQSARYPRIPDGKCSSRNDVFRIENGKVVEEIGEEGALTALQQLGLCPACNWPVRGVAA